MKKAFINNIIWRWVVETGHWSTHNVKVGNNWKMTIDHTNDAKFYESRKNNQCI